MIYLQMVKLLRLQEVCIFGLELFLMMECLLVYGSFKWSIFMLLCTNDHSFSCISEVCSKAVSASATKLSLAFSGSPLPSKQVSTY